MHLEWWQKKKTLPTSRDIHTLLINANAAWDCAPKYNTPEYKEKKELLVFYFDRYLPVIAGKEYWGTDQRYFHLPTDKVEIKGKQRVLVSVPSEAFGWLVLENNREKWINMFQFKEQHGQAKPIPNKGEEAAPFKARWTDSKVGQVKFGGWDEEAFQAYEAWKKLIREFRKDQLEKKDNQCFRYVRDLIREDHGISSETPADKKKRGKKRKTSPNATKKRALREIRMMSEQFAAFLFE